MMNQRLTDGMTHDQLLQLLLKVVCEAGYWAVLIVPVGFRMASCGLLGVRRGRRRDAVNNPLALDDEDPTQGARQRVHPRPRVGLGAARRPRLGAFDQSLDGVALPSGLQTLTFGVWFNQSLEQAMLPSGLQKLTFGAAFDQSLGGVVLPSGLQELTFGENFTNFQQNMDKVKLPPNLQKLSFGFHFNQSLQNVIWPPELQELNFGDRFNQNLDVVRLLRPNVRIVGGRFGS